MSFIAFVSVFGMILNYSVIGLMIELMVDGGRVFEDHGNTILSVVLEIIQLEKF